MENSVIFEGETASGATGNKLRLLYLYMHLVQNTDPDHPLSAAQLRNMLKEEHNLKVSRNTISDDLSMLHDCGFHIEHFRSTQNQYYFDGYLFQQPELKILIDAVASSKFITQQKSEDLINRLLTMTTKENARKLRRYVYPSERVKSENEKGYYIVDALNEAIHIHRKVTFLYTDYDVQKRRRVLNGGAVYTLSPYALVWNGDFYYVRGFCEERQSMRNFRIDRIENCPKILKEAAVPPPEGFSPADYSKSVFRMYDTEDPVDVELYCNVSAMKYLIDQFGSDVTVETIALASPAGGREPPEKEIASETIKIPETAYLKSSAVTTDPSTSAEKQTESSPPTEASKSEEKTAIQNAKEFTEAVENTVDDQKVAIDEAHFIARVTVCPSPTFFRWIFGFTGQIKILGPERITAQYRTMLRQAAEEHPIPSEIPETPSSKTVHDKLVRDRIPEMITASGKICVTETLSEEVYLRKLDEKLEEELAEYHRDQNIEELADLLEVLRTCAAAHGYTFEQLEQVRAEKAERCGGFGQRIMLKEVREPDGVSG